MKPESRELRRSNQNAFLVQFALQPLSILFYFLLLILVLKGMFIGMNWPSFRAAGLHGIFLGLFKGLRFDISTLAYCVFPAILLFFVLVELKVPRIAFVLRAYLAGFATLLTFVVLADIQYFGEAGKHFTYEALSYLGISFLPILSTAFKLHPWFSMGS